MERIMYTTLWNSGTIELGLKNSKDRFSTRFGRKTVIIAPEITNSTAEERREYIKKKYPCIADCDMCGLCKVFHGRDAEHAFEDYISGKRSFMDVSADYNR